jgi:3-hydroxyisobutyrate dehydrogenase
MGAQSQVTIGMLGIGRMGGPIRARLGAAGYRVSAFDPAFTDSTGVAEPLEVAAADILITVLPGPIELESAMADVIPSMRAGSVWLDLTSGDPRASRRLAADAAARGILTVGAPMGGGPTDAAAGTLTFFVDGAPAAVDAVRPVLAELGSAAGLRWVGAEPGQAQVAKLLANLLWFGQAAAVTEALLLGQSLGLDPVRLRDTLATSAGASEFLAGSTDALFAGDYLESFALGRVIEELETLESLARETASPYGLSTDVTDLYRQARAEFGDVDGELLVAKLLEKRAGRTLRSSD